MIQLGTFYTLGVITSFKVDSKSISTIKEWEEVLKERLDLDLFSLKIEESKLSGTLDPDVFKQNIHGLYAVLRKISSPLCNGNIDYYEEIGGDSIDGYQNEYAELYIKTPNEKKLTIKCNFAMLFIEGKVSVEEFYTEPQITNWLFRNSNIENKLSGCMISDVVG